MNRLSAITAMLISNDQILRLGVQDIIETQEHMRLLVSPAGATETEETLAREQPDVVIIDSKPAADLAGLIQKIKALAPKARIVLLIGFEGATCHRDALSSGVDGVILKVQPPEVLVACLDSLCGTTPTASISPAGATAPAAASGDMKASAGPGPQGLPWSGSLTEREREIILLIGRGLSNKDIADRLHISVITVRHHLTSIFDKLGVATRQKLLIRAHQYGLVDFSLPPDA
jgi:DNA-binding NarL/FixJ family response regulator